MVQAKAKSVILGGSYSGIMAALRPLGKTTQLNTGVTLSNGLTNS